MKRKPNEFQCPYCQYGYYADQSKFFKSEQVMIRYEFSVQTRRRLWGCPECGGVFIDLENI